MLLTFEIKYVIKIKRFGDIVLQKHDFVKIF